jgi:hypothetical protein
MLRYQVPVDDDSHGLRPIGDPVRVETTANPAVVEFWAEGDPDTFDPGPYRMFQVFGTGHPLPPNARWRGTTARYAGLVWHLYEMSGPS